MNVLITGSSGRIGSAIASRVSLDHEACGIDLVEGAFTQYIGDIRDRDFIASAMQGIDAVIHVAALHAPHVGRLEDAEFIDVNVSATRQLLSLASESAVSRFVLTSTTSVYGDSMVSGDRAVWVTEQLLPRPRDIYDETKLQAEAACREAAGKGFRCSVIRMSRCFPEADHLMAIYRLYRGVDSRDVAEAHSLALLREGNPFEIYNISGPTPFTQSEAKALFEDASSVIQHHYPWATEVFEKRGWALPARIDRVYVSEKAQRDLGYQPRYGFSSLLQHK